MVQIFRRMTNTETSFKSMYNLEDLYKIIQTQQSTINKLNSEVVPSNQF